MKNASKLVQLENFISRHVHSVEHLEILCLLADNPSRPWSINEVFQKIRSSEQSVAVILRAFVHQGLVSESMGHYRFGPAVRETAASAVELAKAYRERPVSTLEMLYRTRLQPPGGPGEGSGPQKSR